MLATHRGRPLLLGLLLLLLLLRQHACQQRQDGRACAVVRVAGRRRRSSARGVGCSRRQLLRAGGAPTHGQRQLGDSDGLHARGGASAWGVVSRGAHFEARGGQLPAPGHPGAVYKDAGAHLCCQHGLAINIVLQRREGEGRGRVPEVGSGWRRRLGSKRAGMPGPLPEGGRQACAGLYGSTASRARQRHLPRCKWPTGACSVPPEWPQWAALQSPGAGRAARPCRCRQR